MTTAQKPFEIISTLPPNLQPTAERLVAFISPHVQSTNGSKLFNWSSFKNAVDDYEGVELVIGGFHSPSASKTPFNSLPSQCAGHIVKPLSMPIAEDDITPVLKRALVNLKAAKENGWASFKEVSEGHTKPGSFPLYRSTTVPPVNGWEYRALVLAENRSQTSDFIAMVVTIFITSSKHPKEEDWFNLDEGSSEEMTLDLKSMKLAVEPGFQAP
ncbi:putative delta-endotoxin CytB [Rhizoctonia solani 123E]|uniref:Putative delta-endotoxin CytB n=1 Tax=Rhizoctonia solani 123E TaxID=1423351 RepID=A0A074RJM6_9AGAM|nr:putative delta-endotoxin CytB [Rhizoctonia solani 123E]